MRKLDVEGIIKKVKRYAEDLIKRKEVEAVVLFGSLAKGNYTPSSDIDILVLVEKSQERPIDRPIRYMDPSLPLDLQLFVLTKEELAEMAAEGRKIVEEIVNNGILLAGDGEILKKVISKGHV